MQCPADQALRRELRLFRSHMGRFRSHMGRFRSHMGRFRSHMGPPAAAKHRVQGSPRLALLVAQVGQGEERLGVVVGGYRIRDATVGATVRVSEAKANCRAAVDQHAACVRRGVVSSAQDHQTMRIVVSPFGAQLHMMYVGCPE